MPLLDHFHPPLSEVRHWEAFHTRLATAISDYLNVKDFRLPNRWILTDQDGTWPRLPLYA